MLNKRADRATLSSAKHKHHATDRQRQIQREYRQRQKRGERMLRIKVGDAVIEALLLRGLGDADSRDDKKVAHELAEILAQWAAEWIKIIR